MSLSLLSSTVLTALQAINPETACRPGWPFVPAAVTDIGQEPGELFTILRRYLHADQHAPVIGAMVAVVEQGNVPARAHVVQEVHQAPGRSGNRSGRDLVLDPRHVAADQMARAAGHLVVSQVERGIAVLPQLLDQRPRFGAAGDLDADKDVRFALVVVAVVELP